MLNRSRTCGLVLAALLFTSLAAALPSTGQPAAPSSTYQGRQSNQSQIEVRWTISPSNPDMASVEVHGITVSRLQQLKRAVLKPADWQSILSVFVSSDPNDSSSPSMLGTYEVQSSVLKFEPKFPLQQGVTYRAILRPEFLTKNGNRTATRPIVADFRLASRSLAPVTVVSNIYPTAGVLPENLLKFYINFSSPMSRGRVYDHIRLIDAVGEKVDLAFLELDEELWDPTFTRLTLIIDPGRIKRGVLPLEEVGAALEAGKNYKLVVDASWLDANGIPLKQNFEKSFTVGPADRDPPDPARWKLSIPKKDTHEALTVTFPEPMDYALSRRVIRVADGTGAIVTGETSMADQERRWSFVPEKPWTAGQYTLIIDTTIEDLAGNNIGKPFDVDLFEGVQRRVTNSTFKLPFELRQ
jgi:hypothetical protein